MPETEWVSVSADAVTAIAPLLEGVNEPVKSPSARDVSATGAPLTDTDASTPGVAQCVASTPISSASPTRASNAGAGASTHTRGAPAHRTAEFTFSRPPVRTTSCSQLTGSTERSKSAFSPTSEAAGNAAFASAAAPATCGAAIDVPESKRYPPPGDVEKTFIPGAARSTAARP